MFDTYREDQIASEIDGGAETTDIYQNRIYSNKINFGQLWISHDIRSQKYLILYRWTNRNGLKGI